MKQKITLIPALLLVLALGACRDKTTKTERENTPIKVETPRTHAELSVKEGGSWEGKVYRGGSFVQVTDFQVPEMHTDHSGYLRYEGPGWENAQVGYRLYLDWRNAIDIFGKKVDTMVLHQVGHPHSPSYHMDAPWGLDILKAGKSMGLGGFGRYVKDSVAHFEQVGSTRVTIDNRTDGSTVHIAYGDWATGKDTIDLQARLSIFPEDRYTLVELQPSTAISGLSTGIVKFADIPLQRKESPNGNWAYLATYGKQTLAGEDDLLGMALLYKKAEVAEILEGRDDHLVVFAPKEQVSYYFLAAWDQEKSPLATEQDFLADLDRKLELLDKNGKL